MQNRAPDSIQVSFFSSHEHPKLLCEQRAMQNMKSFMLTKQSEVVHAILCCGASVGGAGKYNILVAADTYDCPGYSQDCNAVGLTDNGKFMITKLAEKGMPYRVLPCLLVLWDVIMDVQYSLQGICGYASTARIVGCYCTS